MTTTHHQEHQLGVHVWKSLTPAQQKPSLKLWPSCDLKDNAAKLVYAEVNGVAYVHYPSSNNFFLHSIMKNFEAVCALENRLEYSQSDYYGVGGIKHSNVAVEHIEQNITRSPSSHIKITFDLHWQADGERHSDTRFIAVFKPLP